MKKILLIGDSIRLGYDKWVADALKDRAQVYFPKENCEYAENVLRFLHEWVSADGLGANLDVIHWNAGLWDCLRLFGDDPMTPIEVYGSYITRIQKRIVRLFPNAVSIFAASTPIREEKYSPDFRRYNAEIEAYNAAARKALEGTGARIDDLYAVMKDVPVSCYSDATHFYTPEGTEIIGSAVLNSILAVL